MARGATIFVVLLGLAAALVVHKPKGNTQFKVDKKEGGNQKTGVGLSKQALARSNLDVMQLDGNNHTFGIQRNSFVWDDKPVALQAGEVHYFRIPSMYWKDRLLRVKAMGMNSIQTYVPWNFHETEEGKYDFHSEMHDLIKFLQLAKELNLPVVLRPGPYICAEWTGGGLPGWLQSNPELKLRTYEKNFIAKVNVWWGKLLPMIKPELAQNGGAVIMVQLENEYGVLGDTINNVQDRKYIEHLRDLAVTHLGNDTQLFTDDAAFGASPINEAMFLRGGIKGVFRAINLGHELINDDVAWTAALSAQRRSNAKGQSPMYVAETYSGWFTKWEEARITRKKSKDVAKAMVRLRNAGASVGLYMAHGGTNFGFWAGSNDGGFLTSYDYNAPIREGGDHGMGLEGQDKYEALKEAFGAGRELPEEPAQPVFQKLDSISMRHAASLQSTKSDLCHKGWQPSKGGPQTAEKLGHFLGLMAYRYTSSKIDMSNQVIDAEASDPTHVYVNDQYMKEFKGTKHNVQLKATTPKIKFESHKGPHVLDIVVDTCGRANFGMSKKQMHDTKGLWSAKLGKKALNAEDGEWSACALRFENVSALSEVGQLRQSKKENAGPAFYFAKVEVRDTTKDTWLHHGEGWEKGVVFFNGFNLGRYDTKSPQKELYVPASILKEGSNEILILETGEQKQKMGQIDFMDKRITRT